MRRGSRITAHACASRASCSRRSGLWLWRHRTWPYTRRTLKPRFALRICDQYMPGRSSHNRRVPPRSQLPWPASCKELRKVIASRCSWLVEGRPDYFFAATQAPHLALQAPHLVFALTLVLVLVLLTFALQAPHLALQAPHLAAAAVCFGPHLAAVQPAANALPLRAAAVSTADASVLERL